VALEKVFQKFELEFNKLWNKYVDLHKELDGYRGIEITEKNVGEINKIVSKLQDCWIELFPVVNWIKVRNDLASHALNEHAKFMDDIKAGGAQPVVQKEKEAEA
jgi:hypothetical protein